MKPEQANAKIGILVKCQNTKNRTRLIDKDKSLWRAYGTMMDSGAGFEGKKPPADGLGTTDRDGKPRGTSFSGLLS